ncbi:MAG: ABC transporter ATP-binding protein [Actinobacteria bacterium]|uniref:Efflux ABC transporter, ATP-binding protein n=1 Tax=hydrothermal vent metagenome TaxID=652676 RepID=A0A3B0SRD2_9ZZZZ|nr:ABC transporter ATP-binding protein [Actinomycetota bacterium]
MIEFESVGKSYGSLKALDGAELRIPEGSVYGIIGPNGAGKTTAMSIMAGLLKRDTGKVRVAGEDPQRDSKAVRAAVGYMPDFFGVYDGLTAAEYLLFFAATQSVRAQARKAVVADLLALVDLEDKADDDVNGLSRGMKQRLSLARALVHDPSVLILDEPASGLDPRARVHLRELVAELNRMGRTIVISSHILSELEGMCSHLAVIDHGKVVVEGTVDELRNDAVGHRTVRVRVHETAVEAAERWLRDQPEVGSVAVERDVCDFKFAGDDAVGAELLRRAIGADIPVLEWTFQGQSLENIFMSLTVGAEGEQP